MQKHPLPGLTYPHHRLDGENVLALGSRHFGQIAPGNDEEQQSHDRAGPAQNVTSIPSAGRKGNLLIPERTGGA